MSPPLFRVSRIFAVSCLALLVLLVFYRSRTTPGTVDERTVLTEMAPAVLFSPKGGMPPHYYGGDGSVVYNSFDVTPEIRGYAGPIKIMVRLDGSARIQNIRILSHNETRNYVHRLETPEFLGQFSGKNVRDPFAIDEDLDGISRATVTVQAVGDTLRESGRAVAREVLGLSIPGARGRTRPVLGALVYGLLLILASGLFLYSKRNDRGLRFRDACLALSLAIVGLWLSSPFSLIHVLNVIMTGLPNHALWYVAVAGVFFSFVTWGRFYCGWLCPFGALTEFLNRLPVGKWRVSPDFETRWRNLKYLVLGLAVLAAAYTGRAGTAGFETYVTLFSWNGSWAGWTLVGFALIAELRVPRLWCRYLCPVGALGGLLSRDEPGYPSRGDCPMANPHRPPGSECIRCNLCRHRGEVDRE